MPWLHSFLFTSSLMTSLPASSSSSSVFVPVSIFMCFSTKALTKLIALGTRFFRGAIHARLKGIVYILSSTISSSGISSRFLSFSPASSSSSAAFSSSSDGAPAAASSVTSFVSSVVSSVSASSSVPSVDSASSVVVSAVASVSVSSMDSSSVSWASSVGCSFSFRLLSSVVSSAFSSGWF